MCGAQPSIQTSKRMYPGVDPRRAPRVYDSPLMLVLVVEMMTKTTMCKWEARGVARPCGSHGTGAATLSRPHAGKGKAFDDRGARGVDSALARASGLLREGSAGHAGPLSLEEGREGRRSESAPGTCGRSRGKGGLHRELH